MHTPHYYDYSTYSNSNSTTIQIFLIIVNIVTKHAVKKNTIMVHECIILRILILLILIS